MDLTEPRPEEKKRFTVFGTLEPDKHAIQQDKIEQLRTIQTNLREKARIMKQLNSKICQLRKERGLNCKEAFQLEQNMKQLLDEYAILWDAFRGKTDQACESNVLIPMKPELALDALSWLTDEAPFKHEREIRSALHAIECNPHLDLATKRIHSRSLAEVINDIKKKIGDDGKNGS